MYRSFPLYRLVSTSHGQRRILKKSPPVQKYIRQAVESGSYRPESDTQQVELNKRKAPYGHQNYRDYPIEYEILTLYPPIPPPPRIPLKFRGMRKRDSHVPTEKLVQEFLKRQTNNNNVEDDDAISKEDYYTKLLGIPPPSSQTTAMGKKSAVLNKAYAFALRQYQVLRQSDDISEQESIEIVEKLLRQEKTDERFQSRKIKNEVQSWRKSEHAKSKQVTNDESGGGWKTMQDDDDAGDINDDSTAAESTSSSSYPSVLHSKPRAIEGMSMWSQRLKAVPYREWTIGATTALDHWIARSILKMEEDTWQSLLEGGDATLVSQANDVIAVRQSLFPETILDANKREQIMYASDDDVDDTLLEEPQQQEQDNDLLSSQDKSIEELLESLGGFDDDEFVEAKKRDEKRFWPSSSVVDEQDLDSKVERLVNALQEWRQRHVESPYEEWSTSEKEDFASWLDTYVETLASKREGELDLVATRKALLESPPIDKDESDKFWQQVCDETEAEILLQSIQKTPVPSPANAATTGERKALEAFATFRDLPYDIQLEKLVNLGTLRPLLDEYASESERVKFLARYGEQLMEGVEMEHLVADPVGPIRGDELGRWGEENEIGGDERFRMEKVAYGSDEFGKERSKRAREMYRAWNTHKAGRARFEEIMFKKDRLGLRYNLDSKGKVHTLPLRNK